MELEAAGEGFRALEGMREKVNRFTCEGEFVDVVAPIFFLSSDVLGPCPDVASTANSSLFPGMLPAAAPK
jgi:hypothetical protein